MATPSGKKQAKRAASAAKLMGDMASACETYAEKTAGRSKTPELASKPDELVELAPIVEKTSGAADLLSATYLPPATLEQGLRDKIALLEKNLAEQIAKNSDLVDELAKYVAAASEMRAVVEKADRAAAEASQRAYAADVANVELKAKLEEAERKLASRAVTAAEPSQHEREVAQAKAAFEKLKTDYYAGMTARHRASHKFGGSESWN